MERLLQCAGVLLVHGWAVCTILRNSAQNGWHIRGYHARIALQAIQRRSGMGGRTRAAQTRPS